MFGFSRRQLLKGLAAIFCIVGISWLAVDYFVPSALLIATLAIVLPVFGFAPRLYGWFVQERLRKLYRRLRVVENAMQVELTVPQAEALQSHLDGVIGRRYLWIAEDFGCCASG